ncbi:Uncharacterised protein [Mycobacterium tuberculosis]|nr:Uncharacterised protein [Mycobacterium tuberculosis]
MVYIGQEFLVLRFYSIPICTMHVLDIEEILLHSPNFIKDLLPFFFRFNP